MFRKLLISLVAVGLVSIFIAEAANALVSRRRNTVENFHLCSEFLPGSTTDRDPCFGGTLVSDALFGAEVLEAVIKASCIMTGQVVCEDPTSTEVCTASDTDAVLDAAEDSFKNNADFGVLEFVTNRTSLDDGEGDFLCGEGEEFIRYWPVTFVAYSVYSGNFTNIPIIEPGITPTPTEYELFEYCESVVGTDDYDCTKLWDSIDGFNGVPKPALPCCSETNTLTVTLQGNGTINADDVPMVCDDDSCSAEYIGAARDDKNGCPEVVLTATAEPGWEFTGWGGGICEGTENCTVTADTIGVTANFELKDSVIVVTVTAESTGGARAWIQEPAQTNFTFPNTKYCTPENGPCIIDTSITPFLGLENIVLKRKGGAFNYWIGGPCGELSNNSVQTCDILLNPFGGPYEITAYFP